MKIGKWLTIIFSVLIFVGLAVFLIVKNSVSGDFDDSSDGNQYATSFTLNCGSTITMPISATLTLKDYYSIAPSSMANKIQVSITTKTGGLSAGDKISFANDTFTASEVGKYIVKFYVNKSKSTYISNSIVLDVVEDDDEDFNIFNQIGYELEQDKPTAFESLFNVGSDYSVSLADNDTITYENSKVTATTLGNQQIAVVLSKNNLEYKFLANVEVKTQANYSISIVKKTMFTTKCKIEYVVLNNGINATNQIVDVQISDLAIAEVDSSSEYPYIFINKKSAGSVIVVLKYSLDNTIVSEQIEITFAGD